MEAKILICIAIVLAALVTLSASYPLHQRASGTTHVPTSTRASRSSTSRGRSTPAPSGNSRTGSGQRTTPDTTSPTEQPQTEDTQSACELQEKEELLRLAVSIESNVNNTQRLARIVNESILKVRDACVYSYLSFICLYACDALDACH